MSLKIECTDCKKSYKVEDSWAGKRVKCKACGNIMVVPTPVVMVEEPAPDSMAGLEAAAASASVSTYIAPPPAHHEAVDPETPYVTIPNEDLIDRWVPWAGVGLFGLSLIVAVAMVVSGASSKTSFNKLPAGAAGIVMLIAVVLILVVGSIMTAASGALMLLGVWIGSQIMKFPNHRMLYWRCIAAAGAALGVNSLLSQAGLDITIVRGILAIAGGTGILWLLLRLRGPQFALSGGLAMLLGYLLPALAILGLQAALKSALPTPTATASSGLTAPPGMTRPTFTSNFALPSFNTQNSLRQTSAAHLKQIYLALNLYTTDHRGAGPATLETLISEGSLPSEELIGPGGLRYHFVGFAPQAPLNAVVAYEEGDRSVLGGVNLLFKDGSIQFFPGNSADAMINGAAAYATNNAPNNQPPNNPPNVFTPPSQPRQRVVTPQPIIPGQAPNTQVMVVDATALLQKFSSAYQSYFSSHHS
jgi:hypothetical protein